MKTGVFGFLFAPEKPVDRVVSAIETFAVIFCGFSALIIMFINIIGRYAFSAGLVWAEEYARYCLIVLVYLGTSMAIKVNRMLKVEILANIFPVLKKPEEFVEIISGIVVSVFLFVLGCQYTSFTKMFKETSAAMNWLPMWVIYAILPVGCVFICYRYFQRAYVLIAGKKAGKEEEA